MRRGFLPLRIPGSSGSSRLGHSPYWSRTGGRYVSGSHQSVSFWATLCRVPVPHPEPTTYRLAWTLLNGSHHKSSVLVAQAAAHLGISHGRDQHLPHFSRAVSLAPLVDVNIVLVSQSSRLTGNLELPDRSVPSRNTRLHKAYSTATSHHQCVTRPSLDRPAPHIYAHSRGCLSQLLATRGVCD